MSGIEQTLTSENIQGLILISGAVLAFGALVKNLEHIISFLGGTFLLKKEYNKSTADFNENMEKKLDDLEAKLAGEVKEVKASLTDDRRTCQGRVFNEIESLKKKKAEAEDLKELSRKLDDSSKQQIELIKITSSIDTKLNMIMSDPRNNSGAD
jgi:vacuolar-type H+-ATPase subunit I/STV1